MLPFIKLQATEMRGTQGSFDVFVSTSNISTIWVGSDGKTNIDFLGGGHISVTDAPDQIFAKMNSSLPL